MDDNERVLDLNNSVDSPTAEEFLAAFDLESMRSMTPEEKKTFIGRLKAELMKLDRVERDRVVVRIKESLRLRQVDAENLNVIYLALCPITFNIRSHAEG